MAGDQEYLEALRGTVSEAKSAINQMDDPDYARIHKLEETGDDRKTLKNFLEEKMDREDTSSAAGTAAPGGINISVSQALVGVFLLGILTGFVGGIVAPVELGTTAQADTQQPPDTDNDPDPSDTGDTVGEISTEGEPVLGDADAAVTMVMYEDFECPFCKKFEDNAYQQIESNYIETGKVKAVWKDFPLPERIHPWADEGAAAMECVFREGGNDVFWTVKDRVFANQDSITQSNVYSKIKGYADTEGVSQSAVQSCIDNGNPMEEVNQDKQEGGSNGVTGTPTVFINGQKIVGAQPFSNFQSAIESELN